MALDCSFEPPDLVVGLFEETREDLGLTRKQTALVFRQRFPRLQVLGSLAQLRVSRNDTQLLLTLDGFLANLIPALVELAFVLVGPFLRHVVRRMHRAGRVVHEEGLVRRHRLLRLDPVDRLVRHVDGEVIVLHLRRIDLLHAVIDERVPLVGLAANESVELVEPLVRGPAIERTRDAGLPGGGFVPLAECTGAVAVEPQHLRQRGHAVRNLPGVAGEGRGGLHDRAGIGRMMVPSGFQRDSRRRTQRGGVEIVEAQAACCELIEGRRADRTTERTGSTEADVVDQHDDHIRCAFRCLDLESRWWLRFSRIQFAVRRTFRLRDRQSRAVEPVLRGNCRRCDGQYDAQVLYSLHVLLPSNEQTVD